MGYFIFSVIFTQHCIPIAHATSPPITFEKIAPRSSVDFVEIKCQNEINLKNYKITDLENTDDDSFLSTTDKLCPANTSITVFWAEGSNSFSGENWEIFISDPAFTNTKDQIALQDETGAFIDAVVYWDGESSFNTSSEIADIDQLISSNVWNGNTSSDAIIIGDDEVFIRNTYDFQKSAWSQTTSETEETTEEENNESSTQENTTQGEEGEIIIYEVMPNPEGTDGPDTEYIILKNIDSKDISLYLWTIEDPTKSYTFDEKTTLKKGKTLTLYRETTKITLNNSNEELSLISPSGKLQDTFAYESSTEGVSLYKKNDVIIERIENTDNEETEDKEEKEEENNTDSSITTPTTITSPTSTSETVSPQTTTTQPTTKTSRSETQTPYTSPYKWRVTHSPQSGFIYTETTLEKGEEREKAQANTPEPPLITALYAQGDKKDHMRFFNNTSETVNLQNYTLTINSKNVSLPNTKLYSKNFFEFETTLADTDMQLSFSNGVKNQNISYEESEKNSYFNLDMQTGLWKWEEDVSENLVNNPANEKISQTEEDDTFLSLLTNTSDTSESGQNINITSEKNPLSYESPSTLPKVYAEGEEDALKSQNMIFANSMWYIVVLIFCFFVIMIGFKFMNEWNKEGKNKTQISQEPQDTNFKSLSKNEEKKPQDILDLSGFGSIKK